MPGNILQQLRAAFEPFRLDWFQVECSCCAVPRLEEDRGPEGLPVPCRTCYKLRER